MAIIPSEVDRALGLLRRTPSLVVMDTEQTCWEGSLERRWAGPGESREVIQIGAVAVDTRDFSETAALEILVRPRLNPILSDFCVRLTGITQERLDVEGTTFPAAWEAWTRFVAGRPVLVYNADETVMRENLRLHGMPDDVPAYHRCRGLLESCGVDMDGVNSGRIARHLGSPKAFREHDALADVRSMAEGLAILAARHAPA